MPTLKLTTKALDKAKASGAATYLWDTELRGFGCPVSSDGRVSWMVQKWQGGRGGKATRVVFGHSPPITLDDARKQATGLLADVSKGADLVSRKEQARKAKREAITGAKLSDAVATYLARNREPGRYWDEVERIFNVDAIPQLGPNTLVATIQKADIRLIVDAKEDKSQGGARFLFAVLRPFFKWCLDKEIISSNPIDGLTGPKPLASRDRVLSDDEIKAFWKASEALGYPFGPMYQLLLLTAQRRDEVAAMEWKELDLDKGEWIIPKERTKNSKEHLVHLTPEAVAILRSIAVSHSLVFTTTGTTHVSGYSRAKTQLDKLMAGVNGELKPFRIHDLRRTAASGMAKLKVPPHIIERVLNHVSGVNGGLVSVYQRYEYEEERKQALEKWASYVSTLTSEKADSNIAVPTGNHAL